MSIVIKGSEPFDVMVASNIANCQTANIKFKNISFRCETIEDADGTVFVKMPSAQPEHLTDDDFETIRIHLNAYKENLCNQQRWKEAEEYQRIIDRFMAFASAQPLDVQMAYYMGLHDGAKECN